MPVLVRNREAGPTVFSIPEDNIQIEWQGSGDPSGGDVQYVPDALVDNIQFSKAIRQGIFEVEKDQESQSESLARQDSAYRVRSSEQASSALSSIDQVADNDMVQVACIGPSTRGTGECGEPVAVREKEARVASKPVLCSRHTGLAPQYAQVETGEMRETADSLEPVKKWVRTQVTARERKQ